jgi:DNA topoisomerase-6 subunit B
MDSLDILLKGVARQIKTMKKKEAHKNQVEEKFALIEQILPQISIKSSKILNLEPPDIKPIISKVMGVVAFREINGELFAENFTEKVQNFKVVLKGEEQFTEKVKNLKPFQKVKLNFSKEIISSAEIYVDLPEPVLLGAYSLPKVFDNE